MPEDFITRSEYNKRVDGIISRFQAEVQRLDLRIDKTEIADTSLKMQIDNRFEKVLDKIEASEKLLSSQVSTLKDDIYRTQSGNMWRVIGWGVSFVFGGGGMFALLQIFHVLK